MGDHASHLIEALAAHQQAGVDEQVLPARDEGVQPRIGDHVDLHRIRIEPGCGEQRVGHAREDPFDLLVADELLGNGRLHGKHQRQQGQHQPCPETPRPRPRAAGPHCDVHGRTGLPTNLGPDKGSKLPT
ncbi:MAG: hypothetical protein R3D03_19305 [Geminicoccaceae bacterium]